MSDIASALFSRRSAAMAMRRLGDERLDGSGIAHGIISYVIGLVLATGLTVASFLLAGTGFIWAPAVPVALVVLAIAQMGIHLSFFLHITSGPESTNNILALAFGVLIVFLLIAGSLWIMANLNQNMLPTGHSGMGH